MKPLKIFIITGISGSGKSTAIDAFEDSGFYCVDNMPVALLPKLLELPVDKSSEMLGLALVMDLRGTDFLSGHGAVFDMLRKSGYRYEILFLEAGDNVLVQRYSQTRRHHPLSHGRSVIEGIRLEKDQLKDLRKVADLIIDTTHYNVHDLKSAIFKIVKKGNKIRTMRINIMSFGFKYGVPADADLIMDVRFLANPYFIPELKELDGESGAVEDFVMKSGETKEFIKKYLDFLDYLIPMYEKEGKAYLTVSIGCTGGRHRSVVVARTVFEHLDRKGKRVGMVHRDIGR